MTRPTFNDPQRPEGPDVTLSDGMTTIDKADKTDIYVQKSDYEKMHNKIGGFEETEQRVFPIILRQCSPSL